MPLTNGFVLALLDGQAVTGSNNAFNSSNPGAQNQTPSVDILQIWSQSGKCILQVTGNGVVNINSAVISPTPGTVVATVAIPQNSYLALGSNPTAAAICNAAFPQNAKAQLDLIQVTSQIGVTGQLPGGGKLVWRLTGAGAASTV